MAPRTTATSRSDSVHQQPSPRSPGAFVPLTEHGTLLVDGVLASNYASFPHGLSHALTAPFRLWPALLSEWFIVGEKNVLVGGLKSLGKMMMETPDGGITRLTSH